jgi:hypothetical protein
MGPNKAAPRTLLTPRPRQTPQGRTTPRDTWRTDEPVQPRRHRGAHRGLPPGQPTIRNPRDQRLTDSERKPRSGALPLRGFRSSCLNPTYQTGMALQLLRRNPRTYSATTTVTVQPKRRHRRRCRGAMSGSAIPAPSIFDSTARSAAPPRPARRPPGWPGRARPTRGACRPPSSCAHRRAHTPTTTSSTAWRPPADAVGQCRQRLRPPAGRVSDLRPRWSPRGPRSGPPKASSA